QGVVRPTNLQVPSNLRLSPASYQSELVMLQDGSIAVLIELEFGWVQSNPHEQRIYVVDPVTGVTDLVYAKTFPSWPPQYSKPSVQIVSPAEGDAFIEGDVVPVRITATDPDGVILKVNVYFNEELAGEASRLDQNTFIFNWTHPQSG